MSLYEGGILIYWLTHYVARAQSALALVWALHTGSDRHASQTLYDVSIFENEEHCFNHHFKCSPCSYCSCSQAYVKSHASFCQLWGHHSRNFLLYLSIIISSKYVNVIQNNNVHVNTVPAAKPVSNIKGLEIQELSFLTMGTVHWDRFQLPCWFDMTVLC